MFESEQAKKKRQSQLGCLGNVFVTKTKIAEDFCMNDCFIFFKEPKRITYIEISNNNLFNPDRL